MRTRIWDMLQSWLTSSRHLEELYVLKLDLQGFSYLECHGYPWYLEVHSVPVNQEVQRILRIENIRNGSSHLDLY